MRLGLRSQKSAAVEPRAAKSRPRALGHLGCHRYRRLLVEPLEHRCLLSGGSGLGGGTSAGQQETLADLPVAAQQAVVSALGQGSSVDPFLQQAKLTASDGAANDLFGSSIAVSGNTVVVGVPQALASPSNGPGAAYVFTASGAGWANMTETAKLTASDGTAQDYFGLFRCNQ